MIQPHIVRFSLYSCLQVKVETIQAMSQLYLEKKRKKNKKYSRVSCLIGLYVILHKDQAVSADFLLLQYG